jgi:hypothetical protein
VARRSGRTGDVLLSQVGRDVENVQRERAGEDEQGRQTGESQRGRRHPQA